MPQNSSAVFFGVVPCRVRFAPIEVDAGGLAGFRKDGLTVGEAGQRRGVEAGKRMEGVAFDVAASDGGVQKAEVEATVMADQDGPLAAG